jgi:hypothetical protein
VARPMPDAAPVTTNAREWARSRLAMDGFLSVTAASGAGQRKSDTAAAPLTAVRSPIPVAIGAYPQLS